MVVDVFCDAVNFDLGKVDFDLWVGTRNCVILSIGNLLLENRPLSNTDAKSKIARTYMVTEHVSVETMLIDKYVFFSVQFGTNIFILNCLLCFDFFLTLSSMHKRTLRFGPSLLFDLLAAFLSTRSC